MKERFLIATEHHARMFKPLLKNNPDAIAYIDNTNRRHLVSKELQGIRINVAHPSRIFIDHLNDPNALLILPIKIGTFTHPYLRSKPGFPQYMASFLKLPPHLVQMDELSLPLKQGYMPLAHAYLSKSKYEHEYFKVLANSYLVGDTATDFSYNGSVSETNTALLLSYDDERKNHVDEVLDLALADIQASYSAGTSSGKLYVKDHPSSKDAGQIQKIKNNLIGVSVEVVDSRLPIDFFIGKVNQAFCQNTLLSHNYLIRHGIASSYYSLPFEDNFEHSFKEKSQMPTHGHLDQKKMSQWQVGTYSLDGKTAARFRDALNNLKSK